MDLKWKIMWDTRYAEPDYAYGTEPNTYFKAKIDTLIPGSILLPAEGEGRNGVYAASLGWHVYAFDISENGKNKAVQLARSRNVHLHYETCTLDEFTFSSKLFDVVACIYAHFPDDCKERYYHQLATMLAPGGFLVFEGFSKEHVVFKEKNPKVGGPSDLNMLFSNAELKSFFSDLEFIELKTEVIPLHEGKYHDGTGSVVRAFAKKKKT